MPATPPPTDSPAPPQAGAAEANPGTEEDVFGQEPVSRFGADVEYRGSAGEHDYVVRVRHRFLDTSFTVVIDGVEHDPKAEEKARKSRQQAQPEADREEVDVDAEAGDGPGRDDGPDAGVGAADDSEPDVDHAGPEGDLRFGYQEGFSTLTCTVRRPKAEGVHKDAEVLRIRTVGLGAAGEVEVRHGFRTTPLAPADGSTSAARDAKRTAHPTRYALIDALATSARYLLPLLGIGALLSGLLDPVFAWIEERVRSVVDAVARATAPAREWIAELLRPIREFFEDLLRPINEFLSWLLTPVRDLLAWLRDLIPDIDLPFDIPPWLLDVVPPVIVVVAVFFMTRAGLRSRREKLAAARADGSADQPGPDREAPRESADAKSEDAESATSADDGRGASQA